MIADLAFPLPFAVISEMLGMPDDDRDRMRDVSHTLVRTLEPLTSPDDITALDRRVRHDVRVTSRT